MASEVSVMLPVRYCPQIEETSCGIAAFEMVYRFFRPSRLSKFSQKKVYRRLKTNDPVKDQFRVRTDDIISLAKERHFNSGWGRVGTFPNRMIMQIRHFVETEKIPLIACQRWKDDDPLTGHFRVIIGINCQSVTFHDPAGERHSSWPLNKFMDYWRTTGPNVTGGVAIWVVDREITSPLDPDQPNQWVALGLWQPTGGLPLPEARQ